MKPKEEAKKTVAKKVTGAKRGRKPSSALQFTNKSDERIAEFEKVLISGVTPDGEELDSKLTLKYKNRISAQRSRASKKQEVDLLSQQVKHLTNKSLLHQLSPATA